MSEAADAALRRQALIRLLDLTALGTGRCPDCRQAAEMFSRRRASPGAAKERCLVCWRAKG